MAYSIGFIGLSIPPQKKNKQVCPIKYGLAATLDTVSHNILYRPSSRDTVSQGTVYPSAYTYRDTVSQNTLYHSSYTYRDTVSQSTLKTGPPESLQPYLALMPLSKAEVLGPWAVLYAILKSRVPGLRPLVPTTLHHSSSLYYLLFSIF